MPNFQVFRPMDWDGLVYEYDLDGSRLLPWQNYPMPFSGAWCVVRPHTRSAAHTQVDQEIFIAVKGKADLIVGDETYEFKIGDIAAIPKHVNHYVENTSDEPFHFYVVWWDEDHAEKYLATMKQVPDACYG